MRRGWIAQGPAGELEVAALAQLAARTARTNAPGLLYVLLRAARSSRRRITLRDEDAARALLGASPPVRRTQHAPEHAARAVADALEALRATTEHDA